MFGEKEKKDVRAKTFFCCLDYEAWKLYDDDIYGVQVVSLAEKLQAKEEIGTPPSMVQKVEPLEAEADAATAPPAPCRVKVEDRLSSGTGASGVVDEDGPQLLDSGDSYFQNADYPGCLGVQSEEDDGSDDGQSYFSDPLVLAEHNHEEGESLIWWGWP